MWGEILKRDLLGLSREEDKFHSKEQLKEYLISEVKRQGENVVIRNLDVSLVKDMSNLFMDIIDDVNTLDLSGWKTSNVKDMGGMFIGCMNIKSLDLSGWDTSNVEDMTYMFCICKNLKSLNMSGWDIFNVKSISWMFSQCESIESLDLSGWDTSNVKDMSGIFSDCKSLKSLDLSGWDTSNVKDMRWMFSKCPAPYKRIGKKIVRLS